MPEVTNPELNDPDPDLHCKVHEGTVLIRHLEHAGDGKAVWSKWYCPLCQELAAKKTAAAEQPAPKAAGSALSSQADRKEPAAAPAVKPA